MAFDDSNDRVVVFGIAGVGDVHSELAPAAGLCSRIVRQVEDDGEGEGCGHAAASASRSLRTSRIICARFFV
jgi:hypothetical protein